MMAPAVENSDKLYRTSNTPLAAYLHSESVGFVGIELNGRRGFFVFRNPSQKLIDNYSSGQAVVNVLLYNRSYNYLISLLRRKQRENGNGSPTY